MAQSRLPERTVVRLFVARLIGILVDTVAMVVLSYISATCGKTSSDQNNGMGIAAVRSSKPYPDSSAPSKISADITDSQV